MTYSVMTLGGKTVGGTAFVADVVLRPYEQVDAGTTSRKFWGTDGWKPERVVAKLALKLGEKSITVPQEAIGDLADVSLPRGFYLIGQGDAVIVYLHGGDGSAAYEAALLVENGAVTSRTIEFIDASGEQASVVATFPRK